MFTKLPVHDSVHRRATLLKNVRPRTETTNKLNLARRQMAMITRYVVIEVVGSIHTLYIVVESSFLLFFCTDKHLTL